MTEKEWERYITFSDWKVRVDIAFSEKTPLWVLKKMVNDEDIWVLYSLTINPKTTPKMLDEIMEVALFRNYDSLPYSIMMCPKCSENTMLKFFSHIKFNGQILYCHTQSP